MKLSVRLFFGLFFFLFMARMSAQSVRVITTAVPFLIISPDARASGLGDQGVASTPDVFSQFWNASKYAFAEEQFGIGVSYTPYLSRVTNDMSIVYLTFYSKLNERSAYGVSMRYFGLGEIQLTDQEGNPLTTVKPNDFSVDASYNMQLSPNYAMGVTLRFIVSDMKLETTQADATAAKNMAFDISGYYSSHRVPFADAEAIYRFGFNLMNMGPKIKYYKSEEGDFMPTNLKLGGRLDYLMDEYNTLGLTLEFNKLLVPTPPERDADGTIIAGKDDNVSWMQGVFQSFYDAPGGLSEELKEITWSAGLEYEYMESFKFRAGYFRESEMKGQRRWMTVGAGFKYNYTLIDVSYLFSTSKIRTPLDGTMRFSLSFFLDRKGAQKTENK
ncbi:MAG: type IX secretion system outer membrane channel protein PorV [Chlorobi bacterium]|nr:type IX secretion system outer membrane channel protein PorV [Chlorobiota bacterium]